MLQKYNTWKIASVFFENPDKLFELREISRAVKIAPLSVKNHLSILIAEKIVTTTEKISNSKRYPIYSANKLAIPFNQTKMIHNLDVIYSSGIVKYLEDECLPNAIVLFGSFRRAEDNIHSDIDLYLQCAEKQLDLEDFEVILKRKIQILFNSKFNSYSKELQNNICNGIVLSGYLEAIK